MKSKPLITHGYIVTVIVYLIISSFLMFYISLSGSNYETIGNSSSFYKIYNSPSWVFLHFFSNGIFCALDAEDLKEKNIIIKYPALMGACLVPVYIYVRGSKLNNKYKLGWLKSQTPFLAWWAVLFISFLIDSILLNDIY